MAFLQEYTLLSELGKGGFATVYKVRHNELGYIRAVRVLNDTIKDKGEKTYKNFLHECRMLLVLGNGNHRGIVHIYKPDFLDNKAVVEMDYVDGKDLLHYLADNKYFLPVDEVIRMVVEMSSALAYCHEDIYKFRMDRDEDGLVSDPIDGDRLLIDDATRQKLIDKYKVIHNDIHSRNIMRRENGDFVLLDFGLAIEGDEVVVSSNRRNNGALDYISPEKRENAKVLTTESDIYSFGIVMFEYLTGRVPYKMDGKPFSEQIELYEKIKQGYIPSIYDMRKASYEAKYPDEKYEKDYPDWLYEAIMKCLNKEPAKRYRDAKELYDFVCKHIEEDKKVAIASEVNKISQEKNLLIKDLQTANEKLNELKKTLDSLENNKNGSAGAKILCVVFTIIAVVFAILFFTRNNDGVDRSELVSKQNEIDSLKNQVMSLENENTKLKDNSGSNSSVADLAAKQKEIDNLKNQVMSLENENTKLKDNSGSNSSASDLAAKQKEIDNLKSKVKSLENENSIFMKNNNSSAADLAAKQKEIDNLRNQVMSLENENSKLKKNNNSSAADLAAKQKEIAQLKNTLAQKEKEIRVLQDAIRN